MGSPGFPTADATTQRPSRRGQYVQPIRPALRSPITPIERLVLARLEGESAMDLEMLLGLVSQDVYLDALHHGAWIVDIGILGWKPLIPEVAAEIEAADGILWQIGAAAGGN